jgi:SAM-dependent methyltransferase
MSRTHRPGIGGATESAVQTTRTTYDEIAGAYFTHWRERVPDGLAAFRAALPDGAIVGDVGCGPGHHTIMLRELGLRVIGLDLSEGMLRTGGPQPVGLVQADMRALPMRTGVLDGIWREAALLHLPRTLVPVTLGEFGRVLRAGGVLHLVVAEGDGEGYESDLYEGRLRWFTRHREAGLRALLGDAGFVVDGVGRTSAFRDWLTLDATREG